MPDTNQPPQPLIETGQIIPAFTLPGSDGMPHSPWTYKQREHLLLLFTRSTTDNETRVLLQAFAHEYKSFREEECALLAISPDTVFVNLQTQQELNLPFPLLANPKGEVIARYTRWDGAKKMVMPSMVLADRYGALYQQWMGKRGLDLVSIEEILEVLRYLNRLCAP